MVVLRATELLPCPWCGGKAKVNELRRGNYRREGDNYQVVCNKCRARGPLIQNESYQAAAAWNARPSQAQDGYEAASAAECAKGNS